MAGTRSNPTASGGAPKEIPTISELILWPGRVLAGPRSHGGRELHEFRYERIENGSNLKSTHEGIVSVSALQSHALCWMAAQLMLAPGQYVHGSRFCSGGPEYVAKVIGRLQLELRTGGGVRAPIENNKQGGYRLGLRPNQVQIRKDFIDQVDDLPLREFLQTVLKRRNR